MGGLLHRLRYPRRCYLVCAIARSGSNLLTDGLHETRLAGRPKQFFLRKNEAGYIKRHGLKPGVGFAGYVRGIQNAACTSNEVFGFKLMSWYLEGFLTRLRETGAFGNATTPLLDLLRNAFPRLQFIHISRRDKLRQALSKARAAQTGLWKIKYGESPVPKEAEFDPDLIEKSIAEIKLLEQLWEQFFQRLGLEPFRVEYESLCREYEATIRGILDYLEISLPKSVHIGPPVTVRQADALSDAWEERILAERPHLQSFAQLSHV
jgi:trehalose 2-sulfotransferase